MLEEQNWRKQIQTKDLDALAELHEKAVIRMAGNMQVYIEEKKSRGDLRGGLGLEQVLLQNCEVENCWCL